MIYDYKCPYCSNEIEDPDYWENIPEEEYEVECESCGRVFNIFYFYSPTFMVKVPSELEQCSGCDYWSLFDDCCGFETKKRNKIDVSAIFTGFKPAKPLSGCSLEHDMERD